MKFSTRAIHVGRARSTTASTIPPIHLSTTTQAVPGSTWAKYSRPKPNRKALEQCLASLEEGRLAAFSSGLGSYTAIFQALEPGTALSEDMTFTAAFRLLDKVFRRWGPEVAFAGDSSLERTIGP
jgi:cystathionine beta-lyase/cystathionine gamma-synthase